MNEHARNALIAVSVVFGSVVPASVLNNLVFNNLMDQTVGQLWTLGNFMRVLQKEHNDSNASCGYCYADDDQYFCFVNSNDNSGIGSLISLSNCYPDVPVDSFKPNFLSDGRVTLGVALGVNAMATILILSFGACCRLSKFTVASVSAMVAWCTVVELAAFQTTSPFSGGDISGSDNILAPAVECDFCLQAVLNAAVNISALPKYDEVTIGSGSGAGLVTAFWCGIAFGLLMPLAVTVRMHDATYEPIKECVGGLSGTILPGIFSRARSFCASISDRFGRQPLLPSPQHEERRGLLEMSRRPGNA